MGKIILTGDRPTGRLHLGHYVGSLRRRVEVPITAVNMPEGKVLRTFPSRVKVLFTTGAGQFRSIRPELFKVEADYWEIQSRPSDKCALHLRSVPYGVRNARLEPTQVDYLIEAQ